MSGLNISFNNPGRGGRIDVEERIPSKEALWLHFLSWRGFKDRSAHFLFIFFLQLSVWIDNEVAAA